MQAAEGGAGPRTLAKRKTPIFCLLRRGGEVVIRMLADIEQATIGPLLGRTIAEGRVTYADEIAVHARSS